MAKLTQCLGIDIGTYSVRVAELALSGKRVQVKNMMEARLNVDPELDEPGRHGAIAAQLNELLTANGVKTKQGVFCIPGQTTFVRQLKIPATTPERLERIVQFEAADKIPFPLDKTRLEYQVFPGEEEGQVEVIMVAIRRDFLDGFMKLVGKTGIKPLAISVSSFALHNFHEFNSTPEGIEQRFATGKPKKGKKKKKKGKGEDPDDTVTEFDGEESFGMEFHEIQACVNFGASIMDLTVPSGGKSGYIGFNRSVPRAGGQVDQAIKTALNLQTAQQAQQVKETKTAVLSQEFELSGDREAIHPQASQAATQVVAQLTAEIRRSLDFYIAQPDGVAPDTLVLSGGLVRMPYFDSYIEEKMGLPVEIASVTSEYIEIDQDKQAQVPQFVIPLGLALQGLGLAQVAVDFVPEDIKNGRAFASNKIPLALASVLLLIALGTGCIAGDKYTQINKQFAEDVDDLIAKSQRDIQALDKTESRNQAIAGQLTKFATIKGYPRYWMDFAVAVHRSRPPEVLVTELDMKKNGVVDIQGVTTKRSAITIFREKLAATTEFVSEVEVTGLPPVVTRQPFEDPVQPFVLRVYTKVREGRTVRLKEGDVVSVDADAPGRAGAATSVQPRSTPAPSRAGGRF